VALNELLAAPRRSRDIYIFHDTDEALDASWSNDRIALEGHGFDVSVVRERTGLVLHPFDLATNKVLALVGRLEPRDWVDVIECDARLQPLGYLAWAACGKDPGFGPKAILAEAARGSRYSTEEIGALDFGDASPDAGALARRWNAMLSKAREIIDALPASEVGRCVLAATGDLARFDVAALSQAIQGGEIRFHAGSIRGAMPRVIAAG
jgi:hypothetical protein